LKTCPQAFSQRQYRIDQHVELGHWLQSTPLLSYEVDKRYCVEQWCNNRCENSAKNLGVQYNWVSYDKSNKPPSTFKYTREYVCRVVRGRNILIVGDSINNQLFLTAIQILGSLNLIARSVDVDRLHSYSNLRGGIGEGFPIPFNISCTHNNFTISYIRTYFLSTKNDKSFSKLNKNLTGIVDKPALWINELHKQKISLLLINRGSHYSWDRYMLSDLNDVFNLLRQKFRHVTVMFRDTNIGHFSIWNASFNSTPLHQPVHETSYNSDKIHQQNYWVKEMIKLHHPQVAILPLSNMTNLRADSHSDGLHYCLYSVYNQWVVSFFETLGIIDKFRNLLTKSRCL